MTSPRLIEVQRLPTSGARAVAPYAVGGSTLARRAAARRRCRRHPCRGSTAAAPTPRCVLFAETADGFVRAGSLPVGGGEDVEIFTIGEPHLLRGRLDPQRDDGPYDFATMSPIFRTGCRRLHPPPGDADTYAAKQFRHFRIGGDRLPRHRAGHAGRRSHQRRCCGGMATRFVPFQAPRLRSPVTTSPSSRSTATTYLAHADHAAPSRLYRLRRAAASSTTRSCCPAGGERSSCCATATASASRSPASTATRSCCDGTGGASLDGIRHPRRTGRARVRPRRRDRRHAT